MLRLLSFHSCGDTCWLDVAGAVVEGGRRMFMMDRRAPRGWILCSLCGLLVLVAFALSWITGVIACAATAAAACLWLSRRRQSLWPLLVGLPVCLATPVIVGLGDPILDAHVALYDQTGIATGRLADVQVAYIDVRITRMENCVRYEDSPATNIAKLKADCVKTFIGPVDRKGLEATVKARASGDLVAAQGSLERIYHEPLFRTASSATYPDFIDWWKGDAGLRCGNGMDAGSAVAVIVYCGGSRPDAVASFCATQASEQFRKGEPMLADLCNPGPETRLEVLASEGFSYCFAGVCLYPDARRGASRSVDPLI